MDVERTSDVNMEDSTTEFSTIPLSLEFDEPETVVPENVVDNAPVDVEPQPQPQPEQEPEQEMIVVLEEPCVSAPTSTVTAIRLGSGADDNLSTSVGDVESENMDKRSRRSLRHGRRSRRNRSRSRRGRSRSRRGRSRSRSRSRSRRGRSQRRRSRSRRGRSRRSRSQSSLSRHTRSDESDFSVYIDEDDIAAELVAGSSRSRQKTASGGRRAKKAPLTSRRGENVNRGSHVSKKATHAIRSGRQLARGIRRGRKTPKNAPPRTVWSDRLRSNTTSRKKISKAK